MVRILAFTAKRYNSQTKLTLRYAAVVKVENEGFEEAKTILW